MNPYYPLISALSATIIAQILKPIFSRLAHHPWKLSTIKDSGGFPSSHAAAAIALMIAVALKDGLASSSFAMALVLTMIVCYDAANVRYYAGQNIKITQQLIKDIQVIGQVKLDDPVYRTQVKEVLGHRWFEVFGGVMVGITVALVLLLIL